MADRLALTLPESSGTSNAEAYSRPIKNLAVFTRHQDLAGLDLNMNIPFPTSQTTSDAFRSRNAETPLSIWYNDVGPWIPPGLTSEQDNARASSIAPNLGGNSLAFSGQCHDSIAPSECDTVPPGVIPSDSGYGSYNPRPSVANGSVCDESFDRNQETQSHIGHIGDLPFQSFDQKDDVNQGDPWPQPQGHTAEHQIQIDPALLCDHCGKKLKTKSERKKHNQRHTKPFKCSVEDCTRHREGFSTSNDLDRHIRSVHPFEKASGNRYQCRLGTCKNKDKIWPRADNFKAHLKRVHQQQNLSDEVLEQYVYRYPTPPQESPSIAREQVPSDFSQYGAFSTEQSTYPSSLWDYSQNPNFGLSNGSNLTEHPSQTQVEETTSFPDQPRDISHPIILNTNSESMIHEIGGNLIPDASKTASEPTPVNHDQSQDRTDALKPGHDRINRSHEPGDVLNGPSMSSHMTEAKGECLSGNTDRSADAPNESESRKTTEALSFAVNLADQNELKKFLETLQSRGVLEELGYKREETTQGLEGPKLESVSGSSQDNTHACSECKKTFPRRCELNQHFMLEHWRCDERLKENPTGTCGKSIQRKEVFKHHLESHHQIKDPKIIEYKLETCRLGRNCESRFWCGFCEKIIDIQQKGLKAWTERYNHIDDHFSGRNNQARREISDWKDVDPAHPREDSPVLDSDDSRDSISPPPAGSSTNRSDTSHTTKQQKQYSHSSKPKRKRRDGSTEGGSKRAKQAGKAPLYHCCQCLDIFPMMSQRCICEHNLCRECTYSTRSEEIYPLLSPPLN
ncbi:hypothetical protein F5X99DRAFT_417598 [Biscogniauxia marginata]|nr:hypothetical protein F5X99DRAFT_417598 [Biscogniauxia marginata]